MATYQGAAHVLPAGMCNTKDDLRADGARVTPDFLRLPMLGELLEECYDIEEFEFYRVQNWESAVLDGCRDKGISDTAVEFTGIAFDLLTLRPEICAMIEVAPNDPEGRHPFTLSWE